MTAELRLRHVPSDKLITVRLDKVQVSVPSSRSLFASGLLIMSWRWRRRAVLIVSSGCDKWPKCRLGSSRVPRSGVCISLGVAVFGGTASYVTTWLYSEQIGWVFNVYLIVVALIASGVVLMWKNNHGIPIDQV